MKVWLVRWLTALVPTGDYEEERRFYARARTLGEVELRLGRSDWKRSREAPEGSWSDVVRGGPAIEVTLALEEDWIRPVEELPVPPGRRSRGEG